MKRFLKILTALGLFLATILATAPSAQAASQSNCTFTVPTPTISGGKASWSMSVTCTGLPSTRINRQVVVDLMADDVAIDDVLKWTLKNTKSSGTFTISGSGWPCQEDALGNDEIYLRAHIEVQSAVFPNPWSKGSWVSGPTKSGNCY